MSLSYAKHVDEEDRSVKDIETGEPNVKQSDVVPAEGYASFADKIVRHGFIRKVFGARPSRSSPRPF